MGELIPYGEFAPDISDLDAPVSLDLLNVVPRADGYGPFQALLGFTLTIGARCRGFFFARNTDGSITVFAATSTRIYKMDNTTFGWADVSKGGAAYAGIPASDNWQFVQFNALVIAVQANTAPQVFTLGSSTEFADLGGTPPQARGIAIINRFVVLFGLLSAPFRIQWSDLDGPTNWTAGSGLSDFQDLPDGGIVRTINGGDQYGVIMQESSLRNMVFAPGSAVVFEIVRIAKDDGIFGAYSAITAGDKIFFCSPQGFKRIDPGGYPVPIGKERVDRTFFADVDQGNLQLFIGATDPRSTRVFWAYKSLAGQAGLFDTVLCYDWSIGKGGRWTKLRFMGEYFTALAKPGLTLEGLDAIAPGIITISGAANNGSGAIRLTLSGLTAGTPPSNTDLNVENTVVVYGLIGTGGLTAAANGTWRFTIINSTHIDLIGSTFVGAYSSGGSIGGSLDQLPFSLDSFSTAATSALAAFDTDHTLGFFTGDTLEAVLETGEQDGKGRRMNIQGLRPITDDPNVLMSVGYRETLNGQTAINYTTENAIGVNGIAPAKIDTRYARSRARHPAGSIWVYDTGVEPEFKLTGKR